MHVALAPYPLTRIYENILDVRRYNIAFWPEIQVPDVPNLVGCVLRADASNFL
jgi:hypothetical protein